MFLVTLPVSEVSKCREVIPTIWQWHPPIGVWIALLGGVGVLVPWFRGKAGRREKAFWTFLMLLFVWLEIRTIYLDQSQHDHEQALARCQQLESFQKIADTLNTAISDSSAQFVATMNGMTTILTKQDTTLNQTMGGNSYPKFVATFPRDPSDKEMSVLVITPGHPWPHGHIPTPEETAPLTDVTVDITEWERHANPDEITAPEVDSLLHPAHYNLGTLKVPGMFTAPFKLEKGKRYQLQITTRRGEYREEIRIDRDPSAAVGWRESSCMYGRKNIYTSKTVTSQEYLLDGKCD
jgi:hypothetical protein